MVKSSNVVNSTLIAKEARMEKSESIAGMSIGGGKRENFYFCLLEHFPAQNRWFLTSLKHVRDERVDDSDQAIKNWVKDHGLKKLILDFPLTQPICEICQLDCPGTEKCHNESVVAAREEIEKLLEEDLHKYKAHPKSYEKERVVDGQVHYSKSTFAKATDEHLLSKSFKRKLKKGFLPYWNRPLDVWIWKNYYDQLLETFKTSYDSFGNTSLMLLKRFKYLLRHLPSELNFYESDVRIALLELYRAGIISKKNIIDMGDMELSVFAKMMMIKSIEEKLGIFIYQKDVEVIAKNPKAFDSFILAVCGQRLLMEKVRDLPSWSLGEAANFIAPDFAY